MIHAYDLDRVRNLERHVRWGLREILQGFWIDLRMRLTAHRAGGS